MKTYKLFSHKKRIKHKGSATPPPFAATGNERGSALLVVMIFLAVMISFAMACAVSVTSLQKEIRLIEKKHDARFNERSTSQ